MRLFCLLGTAALSAAALVATAPPATTPATTVVAADTAASVPAGHRLAAGRTLTSPSGRFHAYVRADDGRLVVADRAGHRRWATRTTGAHAVLAVGGNGNVAVGTGPSAWTSGSVGRHTVLRLRDDGRLTLTSGRALVWASSTGNGCGTAAPGKAFVVDLGRQLAWACQERRVVRTTRITSGATAHGNGTPTGRWRVQARVRDTTLRPAGGGSFRVRYWLPYDGAYGLHDSPWQHVPYGSALYRTRGSHGCIHVPGATMAWVYGWARPGTVVRIHR